MPRARVAPGFPDAAYRAGRAWRVRWLRRSWVHPEGFGQKCSLHGQVRHLANARAGKPARNEMARWTAMAAVLGRRETIGSGNAGFSHGPETDCPDATGRLRLAGDLPPSAPQYRPP